MKMHTGLRWALLLLLTLALPFTYQLGRQHGREQGYHQGFARGQVELAIALHGALPYQVDGRTPENSYQRWRSIKDIDLFILTRNGVKTLAWWGDAPKPAKL
ncbi:hypothetical protein [Leeia aquatica]|uniref:Uncharacterized protein n=1 Tax=Leeia aquatica TaxID=2725557 RepID=A0A847S2N2_9NEIS|nr:hypothetical protein [Leeia aquatica]NLR74043.1 hypothetical protein [Leeia aquatica]